MYMKVIPIFIILGIFLTSFGAVGVAPQSANAMNKAELIDSIASSADISKADSKKALDAFIDTTTKTLKKGNRVSLVGFGSFIVKKRSEPARDNGHKSVKVQFRANDGDSDKRGGGNAESIVSQDELAEMMTQEINDDGRHAKEIVDSFFDVFSDTVHDALVNGEHVSLGDDEFGFFYLPMDKNAEKGTDKKHDKQKRKGRNPQTGKEIKIPAKKVVKFKPGAELSSKVK